MREMIVRIPDDAPKTGEEIVRCEECKWAVKIYPHVSHLICGSWGNITKPKAFCSMGERREDG